MSGLTEDLWSIRGEGEIGEACTTVRQVEETEVSRGDRVSRVNLQGNALTEAGVNMFKGVTMMRKGFELL